MVVPRVRGGCFYCMRRIDIRFVEKVVAEVDVPVPNAMVWLRHEENEAVANNAGLSQDMNLPLVGWLF